MYKKAVSGLILFWVSQLLSAGEISPEVAAEKYFDAMKIYDVQKMSTGMHPDAREEFKQAMISLFEGRSEHRALRELLPLFDGISTKEELINLSPVEFYASFQSGLSKLKPDIKIMMNNSTYKVLGYVKENDLAHVVFRLRLNVQGKTISKVSVLSFKKYQDSWGAMLTADMEGIINSMKNSYK